MIFAVPVKTRNGSTVEVIIKKLVLHVERKLNFKVKRIHTDPGSEIQAQIWQHSALTKESEKHHQFLKTSKEMEALNQRWGS